MVPAAISDYYRATRIYSHAAYRIDRHCRGGRYCSHAELRRTVRRLYLGPSEILARICAKFFRAAGTTEKIARPVVIGGGLRRGWVHRHSAHGILGGCWHMAAAANDNRDC